MMPNLQWKLRRFLSWGAVGVLMGLLLPGEAHAARTITSATLNGATSVTVAPGATISAQVNVTTGGTGAAAQWKSTGWRIDTTPPGTVTCVDHANHNAAGNFSETFNLTAPVSGGTYNAYFIAYDDNACGTGASTTFTMTSAVTVDATPPVVSSINRADPSPTGAASVFWTVTFSESVTGVDATDFALVITGGLSGAAITSVAGSGTTWMVSASTGTGEGTLGLNLIDNDSIVDAAGNKLGGTGPGNGNFTGQVYTIARVTNFDAVEVGAAKATPIFTKLAGVNFSLDILALDSGGNLSPGYSGTVTLKLVDAGTGGGVCTSMTELANFGTFTFTAGSGRKTATPLSYVNAARNARIKIEDAAAAITKCSTDNFAIRPTGVGSVSSNMNADATGSSTTATPTAKAGASFTLSATAVAGYDGTPSVDNTKVAAHSGAVQAGTLTGSFSAANPATATATGNAFTYSEVGYFRLQAQGVFDDSFTAVDQPNDCTSDFSNTLVGGKYGCKFGNTSNTDFFGRFYPDHFALSGATLMNRSDIAACAASTFTYMDESLTLAYTLSAHNASGSLTQNYTGSFAKLDTTMPASFNYGAVNGTTNLSGRISFGSFSGTWAAGVTSGLSHPITLARNASPDGPYATLAIGIAPQDSDGVILASYNLDVNNDATNDHAEVGTTQMRFGRLKLSNAHGSELLDLPIWIQTQYWSGTGFVTNALDNCTSLSASHVSLGNYQPAGFSSNIDSPMGSHVSIGGAFAAGVGNLRLTKPTPSAKGSVDAAVNLTAENKTYLQGAWTGSTYDQDPKARATFGVYRGGPVIYMRENF